MSLDRDRPSALRTELASPGDLHLFEIVPHGPTAETSPLVALDVRVVDRGSRVILWIAGRPVRVLAPGTA